MKKTLIFMASMLVIGCSGNGSGNKVPAIDLANLDTTVSPAVDFYRYSTGGWQDANPLGAEFSRYGSFDALRELNNKRINELFSTMADVKAKKGTVEQKISDLYKMALDTTRRNLEGATPIAEDIAKIEAIATKEELVNAIALMHQENSSCFFGAGVEADFTSSEDQILYIGQDGLGMGDRDYYLLESNAALKEGYRNFLTKIFTLAGIENPAQKADNAVKVEEALAQVSWTMEQRRDMLAAYNPYSTEQILQTWPNIGFGQYFENCNIPAQEKIIILEPSYFDGLDKIFATYSIDELKDYLLGSFVSDACGALSEDFYMASWEFFGKQMSGTQEPKPLWKRAMEVPNSLLGEAVGKMYVERYFPESSKKKMLGIVNNLQTALQQHIEELDWMGDITKAKAQEKLSNFIVKIGYPDTWKDYSTLEISPEKSYYANLREASAWYYQDNMSKLGTKTDKTEWGMTPQTVNAYYNPTTNEICFPAAILQPPFFNPDADDAVNYGGIGVVIGHEMSHGFDDQGRNFDKDGNMVNWWTPEDEAKFNEKSLVLVKQFDEIEILPGLMAKGSRTLGENIGDHGGISIAYTAFRNSLNGNEPQPIDGFTADQRFFLSYGQIWAQNITDQEKARLTNLDVHSLAEYRVNMSLRNFQQFFDAFGIVEGDPMFRPEEERVHIW